MPGSHSLNPGLHRLCQALKTSGYDLQATDWPTFFYKDYKYDSENELEGLLKGDIHSHTQHHRDTKQCSWAYLHGSEQMEVPRQHEHPRPNSATWMQ